MQPSGWPVGKPHLTQEEWTRGDQFANSAPNWGVSKKDCKNPALFSPKKSHVRVENGSVLVPKPTFDGKPLMTSLPRLKNLYFWASFRKHKWPKRLGQWGGDFTNTAPKHFNKAQSRSWPTKCSPGRPVGKPHLTQEEWARGDQFANSAPIGGASKKD